MKGKPTRTLTSIKMDESLRRTIKRIAFMYDQSLTSTIEDILEAGVLAFITNMKPADRARWVKLCAVDK